MVRFAALFVGLSFLSLACSTTYRFRGDDLERVRRGDQIANIEGPSSQPVDFTHYSFVYKTSDASAPLRIKGIESLNRSSEEGMLKGALSLEAAPGIGDKAGQRTALGAGIGYLAGVGIGYAITNRILVERSARDGAACTSCTAGMVVLGTLVSGFIGGGLGAVIAYFGGVGVGQTRNAQVQYLGAEPASQPAAEAAPAATE